MLHKFRYIGKDEKGKVHKIHLTLSEVEGGAYTIWCKKNKIIRNTITTDMYTQITIESFDFYQNDIVEITYTLNRTKGRGVIKMIDGCWSIDFTLCDPADRPYCYEVRMKRNFDYLKMFVPVMHNKITIFGNMHEGIFDGPDKDQFFNPWDPQEANNGK